MRAPDGYIYEVVNFTGPLATHTLTVGDGWVQKRHPLEGLRRAGYDGASPAQIKQRHVRHHSTHRVMSPDRERCECGNLLTPGRTTCSYCRAIRHKCFCGRLRKAEDSRCVRCQAAKRRSRYAYKVPA